MEVITASDTWRERKMKKEIYVNDDDEILCWSVSYYPEADKIVLVGCKREPKLVKTDDGWEVLL